MQYNNQIDFVVNNSINPRTMTKFLKKDQLSSNWYEIDAKNAVVEDWLLLFQKLFVEKIKILIRHIWMMEILLLLKILSK